MNALQDPLKLCDFVSQFIPDVGVEIVSVDSTAVLHAVVEPGVDEFDAELLHQQQDVVVDRRDTGRDGDVEGYRAAIVLRHLGRERVATELPLSLEQPEVESVRVVMQSPCGPKP